MKALSLLSIFYSIYFTVSELGSLLDGELSTLYYLLMGSVSLGVIFRVVFFLFSSRFKSLLNLTLRRGVKALVLVVVGHEA